MRQGWTPRSNDGRGIEKIRQLAQRLDKLSASMVGCSSGVRALFAVAYAHYLFHHQTRQASEPTA